MCEHTGVQASSLQVSGPVLLPHTAGRSQGDYWRESKVLPAPVRLSPKGVLEFSEYFLIPPALDKQSCSSPREAVCYYPQMTKLHGEKLRFALVTQHSNSRGCIWKQKLLLSWRKISSFSSRPGCWEAAGLSWAAPWRTEALLPEGLPPSQVPERRESMPQSLLGLQLQWSWQLSSAAVLAPRYLSHVYQALSHLVHWFSPPLCSGTSSLSCPQRSPLHHSIRKDKMTGKRPSGGGEVMRRKNVKLSIFLWSVEQLLRCSSVKLRCAKVETLLAPAECCPLITTHTDMVFCWPRVRRPLSSKSRMPWDFFLALLSGESFSKPCCCFPTPFHLALNPLAAEDNVPQETGQHRHVANKESAQPSKAALCALALMFPADASLLGNFKLYLWKVIWADGKSDTPRTPSTKPWAAVANTVTHLSQLPAL